VKDRCIKSLNRLKKLSADKLVDQRIEKYASMGVWEGSGEA
jgi:acetyl-CoA carboxylase carboxyl transferase subunit alpha